MRTRTRRAVADVAAASNVEFFVYLTLSYTMRSSRTVLIASEQHQIIEGILIGDGWIDKENKNRLSISQKFDKKEFVEHIASKLPFACSVDLYEHKKHWRKKASNSVRYRTVAYEQIYDYWERWYQNGRKVVPNDFEITPISLLYWYCGDGSIHRDSKQVRLHTNSFEQQDLERLQSQFEKLGIYTTIDGRNVTCIRSQCTQRFFELLGSITPFECFAYKWNFVGCIKEHRMTIEQKRCMIERYTNTDTTSYDLGLEFGYSTVAVARMLRTNIDGALYMQLRRKKRSNAKKRRITP